MRVFLPVVALLAVGYAIATQVHAMTGGFVMLAGMMWPFFYTQFVDETDDAPKA
jgi:hypothetical protein